MKKVGDDYESDRMDHVAELVARLPRAKAEDNGCGMRSMFMVHANESQCITPRVVNKTGERMRAPGTLH